MVLLFSMKNQDGKPNEKYVKWFYHAVGEIEDPNDSIIVKVFTKLSKKRFYGYIIWDNQPNKAHLFARCEKYLDK